MGSADEEAKEEEEGQCEAATTIGGARCGHRENEAEGRATEDQGDFPHCSYPTSSTFTCKHRRER